MKKSKLLSLCILLVVLIGMFAMPTAALADTLDCSVGEYQWCSNFCALYSGGDCWWYCDITAYHAACGFNNLP